MSTHTRAIEILFQDVSPSGPDFVSSIYSAAFTLSSVAAAFGNDEPARLMKIRYGTEPPSADEIRDAVGLAWYGDDITTAAQRARDKFRPEFCELFIAIDSSEIPPDDLDFAARVIDRYLTLAIRHHGDVG